MDPKRIAERICAGVSFMSRADRNNAVRVITDAIEREQAKHAKLWHLIDAWCDLQIEQPGATPGPDLLKRAIGRHKPQASYNG